VGQNNQRTYLRAGMCTSSDKELFEDDPHELVGRLRAVFFCIGIDEHNERRANLRR
jgi:hypothetical protein